MSSPRLLVLVFISFFTICLSRPARGQDVHFMQKVPKAGVNNLWYKINDKSDHTVVIIIHGIFSDSRSAWLWEDPKNPDIKSYWPELAFQDYPMQPSVYLAGFTTEMTSGNYDMPQAAGEIATFLKRDRVIEKYKNVILVGHSTGGILARYLLVHNAEMFADKKVGLVMMASPSLGSDYATLLKLPAKFANQKMGQQLQVGNDFLKQLDNDFFDLLRKQPFRELHGLEVIEQRMVVVGKYLPMTAPVVSEVSGSRYFAPAQMVGGTDHFSVVKPNNRRHPSYALFQNFFMDRFYYNRRLPGELANVIKGAEEAIERNPKAPEGWRVLGSAHYEKRNYELSIRFHTEAIKLFPNDMEALLGRATAYMKKNRFDLAITDLTAVIDFDSENQKAPVLRGLCWQKKSETSQDAKLKTEFNEKAIGDFTLALTLHKSQETLWYRANSYGQLGRLEEHYADNDASKLLPSIEPPNRVWTDESR